MAFAIDDLTSVIGHWSADQITGLSDGDPVDTLPDSISSWDVGFTSTARPLYRPASSINSLPAMEFDGSNDFGITGSSKVIAAGDLRMCWVHRMDVLKNFNPYPHLNAVSGLPVYQNANYGVGGQHYTTQSLVATYNSGIVYSILPSAVASTTVYIQTDIFSARNIDSTFNGIGNRHNSDNGLRVDFPGQTSFFSIGANSLSGAYYDGLIAEVVIWHETLLCESLYIEGVLMHKYGVASAFPDSHPFKSAAPTTGPGSGGGTDHFGNGVLFGRALERARS
jgi:hypothetical protein